MPVAAIICSSCISPKVPIAPLPAQEPRENIEIRNIKIVTDGSIDWSSPKSVADATLKGKNDEEKVLNFWYAYRRAEWHYKEWPDRRDFTANILCQGQTLCGSHAALQMQVLRAGGYKTRPCFVAGGGHTFIEVFYDNRWHALDAMTGFYVYSRSEPRYIVSLDEMKADAGIVTNAIAEKRVPDVFLACAREPEIPKKKTLPWSHFKTLDETVMYYADGAKSGSIGKDTDAYGGSFDPKRIVVNLKPGEAFDRAWDMEVGRYPEGWAYDEDVAQGPFHRCGHNDEFDKTNFPYWEPYCKSNFFVYNRKGTNENTGPITMTRCYRYLSNGRFERAISAADIVAKASVTNGVRLDGGFLVASNGVQTGQVDIVTSFPYYLCDADVTVKYARESRKAKLLLYVLENEATGDRKNPLRSVPRLLLDASEKGEAEQTVAIGRFNHGKLNPKTYTLRVVLTPGAALEEMVISSVFTHNMYAGPYLVPGTNRITVTADNGDLLKKHPMVLTYEFADGEGWRNEQAVQTVIRESPCSFTLLVDGPKHPRIKSVRVEVK